LVFRYLLAGMLALTTAPASAAPLATLIIKVEKVSSRGGDLRVALYDRKGYPIDNGTTIADTVVTARPGETIVTLSGIRPGVYAVKMFQDFNRNGKFDMNWIGWPLEKFGFSNDAHPTFSEPPFDATKFDLRPGTNTITIHLQ
jgi:uncharacterized protein (DUF2141 family)